jgi:hypothetical protein
MKKLLCSLLILGCASSSFANCMYDYEDKAEMRDLRNGVVLNLVGSVGGSLLLATPLAPLGLVMYVGNVAYQVDVVMNENNQFEKIVNILRHARYSKLDGKELLQFHEETRAYINNKYKFDISLDETVTLLNEANESEVICPVVKIRKDGTERRAVLNLKSLVRHIGRAAEDKKVQEDIRRIGSN